MYKRVKLKKLGRKKSHRDALIKNQLRSLFTNGYLTTTSVKAKVLRGKTTELISKMNKSASEQILFRNLNSIFGKRSLTEQAMKYAKNEKTGVRIMKVGFRSGDNAEVSKVELIGFEKPKKAKKVVEKKAKVEVKEEKKEVKAPIKKAQSRGLGSAIRETFTGRKERARTRSGL